MNNVLACNLFIRVENMRTNYDVIRVSNYFRPTEGVLLFRLLPSNIDIIHPSTSIVISNYTYRAKSLKRIKYANHFLSMLRTYLEIYINFFLCQRERIMCYYVIWHDVIKHDVTSQRQSTHACTRKDLIYLYAKFYGFMCFQSKVTH